MIYHLDYPLHGYAHTFFIGTLIGIVWATIYYSRNSFFSKLSIFARLPYRKDFKGILLSCILGVWFHVFLDSPLYSDIRPFYPFEANPLYGVVSANIVYLLCLIFLFPAIILYGLQWRKTRHDN